MVSQDEIEAAIYAELDEFQYDDHVTPASINRGECEAFAKAVNKRLDGELTILSTADITGGNPEKKPEPWHVWVTDGERHYDAEHPEGVENWSGLGFFGRIVKKQPSDEF